MAHCAVLPEMRSLEEREPKRVAGQELDHPSCVDGSMGSSAALQEKAPNTSFKILIIILNKKEAFKSKIFIKSNYLAPLRAGFALVLN